MCTNYNSEYTTSSHLHGSHNDRTGKPGKMRKLFQSGNFEQTGEVRKFHPKYWKNEEIVTSFYFIFSMTFLIEAYLLNWFLNLLNSLNIKGLFVEVMPSAINVARGCSYVIFTTSCLQHHICNVISIHRIILICCFSQNHRHRPHSCPWRQQKCLQKYWKIERKYSKDCLKRNPLKRKVWLKRMASLGYRFQVSVVNEPCEVKDSFKRKILLGNFTFLFRLSLLYWKSHGNLSVPKIWEPWSCTLNAPLV